MTKLTTVYLGLVFLIFSGGGFSAAQNTTAVFEQPLLITSAGQNAEVQLAAVLAKRAGLNYVLSKMATATEMENTKTLALVLGASLKGLGAAGLDVDKERERVRALAAEAQQRNIPIFCLHLGGESRRGQQTDSLMAEFLPLAKMAIVVKSGNSDGFFTKICQEKNILLIEVEKTADALEPLQKAFK